MTGSPRKNCNEVQPLQHPANKTDSFRHHHVVTYTDKDTGGNYDNSLFQKDTEEKSNPQGIMMRSTIVIIFVTLPLFVLAISLGWIIVPNLIKQQISNKAVISPEVNPELYSAWVHPPVPVFLKVYLFNVTNPEEVKNGSLPKLQELGPYVFLENRTKVEITPDDLTDTITYKEYISFHFQPDLSGTATLGDVVTLINVPFVAAAIKIGHDLPWPIDDIAKTVLTRFKEPLFVHKTAEEALFKGWKVPFLESIEEEIGFSLIPNNTFGFFIGQNDTAQGPVTVSRGTHKKSSFGSILKFKNETELDFWGDKSTSCNKIQGTDGTIFPPFVSKSSTLRLFNPELCRSLYLTYNNSTEFEGIKAFRFTAPPSVIQDPRKGEENRCFCSTVDNEPEKCLAQGALDLGPCRDGAPVAMSIPHFLDAIPEYIKQSGLTPDREKHETFLEIEPLTGIILRASKKVQINLILKRVNYLSSLKKVPEMLFPLVWADECASLDAENTAKFKSILFTLGLVDFLSKWGSIAIALILSLVCIYLQLKKQHAVLYSASSTVECLDERGDSKKVEATNNGGNANQTFLGTFNDFSSANTNTNEINEEEKRGQTANGTTASSESPWSLRIPLAIPEDDDDID